MESAALIGRARGIALVGVAGLVVVLICVRTCPPRRAPAPEPSPPAATGPAVVEGEEAAQAVADLYVGPRRFCPECQKLGQTSTVRVDGMGITTLMCAHSFYDEQGRHHYHDPNMTTWQFRCSKGHTWQETDGPAPCWCGWPKSKESKPGKAE